MKNMTPPVFTITVEPLMPADQPSAQRGVRAKTYRVFVDGDQITECSSSPLHTACRWLTRQGHKGRALVWLAGEGPPSLCIPDIERWSPALQPSSDVITRDGKTPHVQ